MVKNMCPSRGWVDMSSEGSWRTLHAVTMHKRLPMTE